MRIMMHVYMSLTVPSGHTAMHGGTRVLLKNRLHGAPLVSSIVSAVFRSHESLPVRSRLRISQPLPRFNCMAHTGFRTYEPNLTLLTANDQNHLRRQRGSRNLLLRRFCHLGRYLVRVCWQRTCILQMLSRREENLLCSVTRSHRRFCSTPRP